jgi:hypothetical protein
VAGGGADVATGDADSPGNFGAPNWNLLGSSRIASLASSMNWRQIGPG